jgi:hypothetical protein
MNVICPDQSILLDLFFLLMSDVEYGLKELIILFSLALCHIHIVHSLYFPIMREQVSH